jgi:muconolactone delta-isomerase
MAMPIDSLDCELCIVGAGYAALNALNAAAKYLKRGARVVVIDKRESWGGQWLDQYDFVRLHQPYRMFTAGDQPWKLQRDPSHLATRREVLDHLASIPPISAKQLDVTPLFGHAYEGHSVREGRVELLTKPIRSNGSPVHVRAKRLLRATGAEIRILQALPLSSPRVRSVAVSDPLLTSPEFLAGSENCYIVGGGKTAMDTARHLIQNRRSLKREINVVSGSGMWFFKRDNIFPRGAQRYVRGTPNGDVFLTLAELFDGHNELECMQELQRRGLAHSVWEDGGNCRLGMLSTAERAELRVGVNRVLRGHLVDVAGTRMTLRQGDALQELSVPEGSYFINCTSHLVVRSHEPLLQDSGLVCAPQFALGLSGVSAHFVTHLWLRGELSKLAPELYRIRRDLQPKLRWAPQLGLMVLANMVLMTECLPASIGMRFLGDFNKWYPFYRRLPLTRRFVRSRDALLEKAERLVRLRFADAPDAIDASAVAPPVGLPSRAYA